MAKADDKLAVDAVAVTAAGMSYGKYMAMVKPPKPSAQVQQEEVSSPALPTGKAVRICVVCGKEFVPKRHNSICCCDQCRDERARQRNLAWQNSHYRGKRDGTNKGGSQEEGGNLGRRDGK